MHSECPGIKGIHPPRDKQSATSAQVRGRVQDMVLPDSSSVKDTVFAASRLLAGKRLLANCQSAAVRLSMLNRATPQDDATTTKGRNHQCQKNHP